MVATKLLDIGEADLVAIIFEAFQHQFGKRVNSIGSLNERTRVLNIIEGLSFILLRTIDRYNVLNG